MIAGICPTSTVTFNAATYVLTWTNRNIEPISSASPTGDVRDVHGRSSKEGARWNTSPPSAPWQPGNTEEYWITTRLCQTSESIQTLDSPGSLQIISMFIVVPNVNTPFDRGFVFPGRVSLAAQKLFHGGDTKWSWLMLPAPHHVYMYLSCHASHRRHVALAALAFKGKFLAQTLTAYWRFYGFTLGVY